ncbi:phage portal protein [Planctomicrobium sp. SH527]|uniref:phage portal protein n=1 Tax=Planctomicrobium sp. SH527 TaxID=3448123 RepID=UPI003F5C1CD5
MLSLIRDRFATMGLQARYQRMIQERLLELAESPQPVSNEGDGWQMVGGAKSDSTGGDRSNLRERARRAVRENPYACNILRLLGAYVTGPGLQLNHQPIVTTDDLPPGVATLAAMADQVWKEFQCRNRRHYSFREHALRTWRDGECFIRKFRTKGGQLTIRFVDPELIAESPETLGSQGILTEFNDVECPVTYLQWRHGNESHCEYVPAEEMQQTRIGVDSNEKRGVSLFAPLLDGIDAYEKWLETELLARKLQSSIVLWRKVQGSQFANDVSTHQGNSREGQRERFGPGTILTTNHGTDIQFLQPNTNFGDAVPLGRTMLLGIAAGAGLPEFMLTADASNGNFASTMVAEGPAVKFFQNEQLFFSGEFYAIWKWVMQNAIQEGLLPANFFERITISWSFPSLINRDRPRERLADVRLIEAGVLSRAEVGRRDGVQPEIMHSERTQEDSRSLDPADAQRGT